MQIYGGRYLVSFTVTVNENIIVVPTLSMKPGINNSSDLRLYSNLGDAVRNQNPLWGGGINYTGYVGTGMTLAVIGVMNQYCAYSLPPLRGCDCGKKFYIIFYITHTNIL